MKISGTYFDLLLYNWLPTGATAFLIFICMGYITSEENILELMYGMLILFGTLIIVLWAIDCLRLYIKKYNPLRIDKKLHFKNISIDPQSIIFVTPINKAWTRGFHLRLIEFTYNLNNEKIKTTVLAKQFFFQNFRTKKKSPTLRILLDHFPELIPKLTIEMEK